MARTTQKINILTFYKIKTHKLKLVFGHSGKFFALMYGNPVVSMYICKSEFGVIVITANEIRK